MSNHYYSNGATHNDNHKELNLNGNLTTEQLRLIAASIFADTPCGAATPQNSTSSRGGGLPPTQRPASVTNENTAATLSPTSRDSLARLLAIMDRAPWRSPASHEGVRRFLLTVLAAEGGTPLTSSEDLELSEKMWQLMEQGRGDRTQIVAMNLAGYFVSRGLLPNGSPALAKAMFGKNTDAKYCNINKGNPNCKSFSKGLAEVLPLLERWIDEARE